MKSLLMLRWPLPVLVALAVSACSGPSGPSADEVVLRGTVVNAGGSASAARGSIRSAAAAADIIVTVVENPAITTTVGADGTFTLRGLPDGAFTLQFSNGGVVLGTIPFGSVQPNQEITIKVQVTDSTVTLVEQQRNGIGHGDLEIDGTVSSVIVLDPAVESRFVIAGKTVVARPGQTAIRQGNSSRTVADVTVGRRVHVKGVWLPLEGSLQPVLAHEIKLQGQGGDDDDDDDDGTGQTCIINGGRVGSGIELEGNIDSGAGRAFMLRVNGNRARGPVAVEASGADFKCNGGGPNAPTPEQCVARATPGTKVHVKGTLTSCDQASALTTAREVKVQK